MKRRHDPLGLVVLWDARASTLLRAEVFRWRKARNRNSWTAALWIGRSIVWSRAKFLTARSAAAAIDRQWAIMRRDLTTAGVV